MRGKKGRTQRCEKDTGRKEEVKGGRKSVPVDLQILFFIRMKYYQ
jgi:hypothetical protein